MQLHHKHNPRMQGLHPTARRLPPAAWDLTRLDYWTSPGTLAATGYLHSLTLRVSTVVVKASDEHLRCPELKGPATSREAMGVEAKRGRALPKAIAASSHSMSISPEARLPRTRYGISSASRGQET